MLIDVLDFGPNYETVSKILICFCKIIMYFWKKYLETTSLKNRIIVLQEKYG